MKTKKNPLSKYTDEQLYAELNRRDVDKEALQIKTANINGFTTKDIVCMQHGAYDEIDDEYGPYYHFYLKVDNKLFDLYYMNCVTDGPNGEKDVNCNPSRWPENEIDGSPDALPFVPSEFSESMENYYEYHGKENVKKYLNKCGITDFRVWDAKLVDEQTGRDANYDAN